MNDKDIFRPSRQPAQTIYDAFQTEAAKRKGRPFAEWAKAERDAVWQAAATYAQQHGLRTPLLADVEAAETYARGSVDYGAKWAFQVERAMKSAPNA